MFKIIKQLAAFLLIFALFQIINPDQTHAATQYYGIPLESNTNVFEQPTKNSNILKSYGSGSILKYYSYSSEWYKCTVYLNGKATTGYIAKNSVENTEPKPKTLYGVAQLSSTNVYSKPTGAATVLKQYGQYSVLKYQSFTSEWHKATVYISGKATTGYIRASEVETGDTNPISYKGIALNSPTSVYSMPSTTSGPIKSYSKGNVLIYQSFVPGWYKAKVFVNGVAKSGYINASHVENSDIKPTSYEGVSLTTTRVYSLPNTNSSILKSYGIGRVLYYKSFVHGWYQAKVYLNGKAYNGYIQAKDVENSIVSASNINVRAIVDKVHVYTSPATNAEIHKSYNIGSILKVKDYTSLWYKATVYVNGIAKTGYILKSDTSTNIEPGTYLTLDLRKKSNITATDIVNFFNAKSPGNVLKNYAQDYIDAQNKYGVNAAYLVAHSIWETGWGKSALTLYKNNLYGYGAYNVCPFTCGYYYPSAADSINSVAYMVRKNYLNSDGAYYYPEHGSTLTGMNVKYATDQNWKNGIANLMEQIKEYDDNYYSSRSILPSNTVSPGIFGRDIPKGKTYPTSTIINFPQGIVGEITDTVSFRDLPYTSTATFIKHLNKGAKVEVLGYNTDVRITGTYPYDYRWYRVSVDGQEGWVYGGYLLLQPMLQVKDVTTSLNIRNAAETGDIIGSLAPDQVVMPVLENGEPKKEGNWYKIYLPNSTTKVGYVSGDYIKVLDY